MKKKKERNTVSKLSLSLPQAIKSIHILNPIRDISGFYVYASGVCFFYFMDIVEKFLLVHAYVDRKEKCVKKEGENKRRNNVERGWKDQKGKMKGKRREKNENRDEKEKKLKCFNCIYRVFID